MVFPGALTLMETNFVDPWALLVESNVRGSHFLQHAAAPGVSTHVLERSAQEYANTDIKLDPMVVPLANVTILVLVIPARTEKSASESEMLNALVICALDIPSVSITTIFLGSIDQIYRSQEVRTFFMTMGLGSEPYSWFGFLLLF